MSTVPAHPSQRARAPAFRDPRTDPEAAESLARIAQKYGLKLIVLFGSQATGRTHASSDVDTAVIAREPLRRDECQLDGELSSVLGSDRIDLSVGHHFPALLARNIAVTGIPLYASSPDEWTEFQIRAIKTWDDGARTERFWRSSVEDFLARHPEG